MRPTIVSRTSSSAKWPLSSRRISAEGTSRRNASAPSTVNTGSFLPQTTSVGGFAVLAHEPLDEFGVAHRDPESYGSAVVLHEEPKAPQPQLSDEQLFRDLGEPVEGVAECTGRRSVAQAEPGVVGRDDMELV